MPVNFFISLVSIILFVMPSICKGSCIVEKVSPNIEYVFKCNDKEISVNCLNKDLDKCNFVINTRLSIFNSKFENGKIESISVLSKSDADQKQCSVSDREKNLRCIIENNCQKEKENLGKAIERTTIDLSRQCDTGHKVALNDLAESNKDLISKSCIGQEETNLSLSKNKEKINKLINSEDFVNRCFLSIIDENGVKIVDGKTKQELHKSLLKLYSQYIESENNLCDSFTEIEGKKIIDPGLFLCIKLQEIRSIKNFICAENDAVSNQKTIYQATSETSAAGAQVLGSQAPNLSGEPQTFTVKLDETPLPTIDKTALNKIDRMVASAGGVENLSAEDREVIGATFSGMVEPVQNFANKFDSLTSKFSASNKGNSPSADKTKNTSYSKQARTRDGKFNKITPETIEYGEKNTFPTPVASTGSLVTTGVDQEVTKVGSKSSLVEGGDNSKAFKTLGDSDSRFKTDNLAASRPNDFSGPRDNTLSDPVKLTNQNGFSLPKQTPQEKASYQLFVKALKSAEDVNNLMSIVSGDKNYSEFKYLSDVLKSLNLRSAQQLKSTLEISSKRSPSSAGNSKNPTELKEAAEVVKIFERNGIKISEETTNSTGPTNRQLTVYSPQKTQFVLIIKDGNVRVLKTIRSTDSGDGLTDK
ncbi:MAG: hypothetical protein L6Q37_00025 [Bdellovibrionaceae bacterium]|nr:hypothetical protein [Pseudobdellovibrionaceae bacterium]NUM58514.1 hypothetical protein [Pseudobdellovibrionaceae bacterium]